MNNRCRCIEHLILRPTLRLLGAESDAAVTLLLGTGLAETGFTTPKAGTHGFYGLSAACHHQVWDEYLAFRPERASLIRSLASRVEFLRDPDGELDRNPPYATAIAWEFYAFSGIHLPQRCANQALASIWQATFHPGEALGRDAVLHPWQDLHHPDAA